MKKTVIILSLFFILASVLRLLFLGSTPNSATWDEAALGYNTYSLLQTDADEYGIKNPLILRSFDDYKPALYAYASLLPVKIWGPNMFSIRFVSSIAGSLLVIGVYLLSRIYFNKRISLLAAFLTIFEPLFISYSRIGLEANLSLTLFVFGAAFWLSPLTDQIKRYLGLSLLLLAAYAYHSPRYLIPIIVLLNLKKNLRQLIFFIIGYLPIAYFVFSPIYNTRFREISIFTNYGILFGSIADLGATPSLLANISRVFFYIGDFAGRFLSYLNPYQLFILSSGHPLYVVTQMGVFNTFELPFFILGLISCLKYLKKYFFYWVIIIIGILPAAITVDWFSPLRGLFIWPVMVVFTARGIINLFSSRKLVTLLLCYFIFIPLWLLNVLRILDTIYIYRPYTQSGAYQYGFAQMAPFVKSIEGEYKDIIIESPHAQPHIFMAFFTAYDPKKYQSDTAWRRNDFSPRKNFDFGPYHFRKIYFPVDRSLKGTLFVGNEYSLPTDQLKNLEGIKVFKDFFYPDGNISFRVVGI